MLSRFARATSGLTSAGFFVFPGLRLQRKPISRQMETPTEAPKNQKNKTAEERLREIASKTFTTKTFLTGCSYGGIGLASLMGAYAGKRGGMSPMGCFVLSFINGMGGGSMRDALQGKRVYWLERPVFAWWCFVTGLMGMYLWEPLKQRYGVSEKDRWALAISLCSLGGCTCGGADAALKQGGGGALGQPIKGAIYAMLCATGGGVVMAQLLNKKPLTLYAEGWQNVFPAAVGAVAYQAAYALGLPNVAVVATGFTTSVFYRTYLTRKFAEATARAAATATTATPASAKKKK